jgi:iron complex transport system ATP-binding protein
LGSFRKKGGLVTPLLEIDRVGFAYGAQRVLREVSFSVCRGEIVAVIGPNGCGKTTLLKTVLKNETPDQGSIRFMGRDLRDFPGRDLARQMASVTQVSDPAALTVREYVLLGRLPFFRSFQFFETRQDIRTAENYMQLTGVLPLAHEKITRLSGGERQLCAIARALTQEPDFLVLDEPTSHLDITHQALILNLIHRLRADQGLTVLIVIHDLNLAAEYADRLVLMGREAGQVLKTGPAESVLTPDTVFEAYNTRVRVEPNPISGRPWVWIMNPIESK